MSECCEPERGPQACARARGLRSQSVRGQRRRLRPKHFGDGRTHTHLSRPAKLVILLMLFVLSARCLQQNKSQRGGAGRASCLHLANQGLVGRTPITPPNRARTCSSSTSPMSRLTCRWEALCPRAPPADSSQRRAGSVNVCTVTLRHPLACAHLLCVRCNHTLRGFELLYCVLQTRAGSLAHSYSRLSTGQALGWVESARTPAKLMGMHAFCPAGYELGMQCVARGLRC